MRFLAHLLAFIFHPLLILTWGLMLHLMVDPYAFGVANVWDEVPLVVITLLYTFFLPLISTLFMSLTGLINSVTLKERWERIGPLIASIIFYAWFHLNMLDNPDIPRTFNILALGALIALGLSFVVTVFSKISLHCVGMGGLLGFMVILYWNYGYSYLRFAGMEVELSIVIMALILLAGLVGTTRLYLQVHDARDIYGGYLVGLASQFLALRFLV